MARGHVRAATQLDRVAPRAMWAQFRDGEHPGEETEPLAQGSSQASFRLPSKWPCPMASGDRSAVLRKQMDRHHPPTRAGDAAGSVGRRESSHLNQTLRRLDLGLLASRTLRDMILLFRPPVWALMATGADAASSVLLSTKSAHAQGTLGGNQRWGHRGGLEPVSEVAVLPPPLPSPRAAFSLTP